MAAVRIGVIDDHPFMEEVIAALFPGDSDVRVVGFGATVDELLQAFPSLEIAVLDLRLRDGSSPVQNIRRLREAGARVVVYTSGESAFLLRAAARIGADSIVHKTDDPARLRVAIERVIKGAPHLTIDLATAIESDPALADAGLSMREREVLGLYADGLTNRAVANETGLSEHTVEKYITNIRRKYEGVNRQTRSRVDLYRRAVEDGMLPEPGLPR
jgi:DNA-binding NarL/FixJ family response regulator